MAGDDDFLTETASDYELQTGAAPKWDQMVQDFGLLSNERRAAILKQYGKDFKRRSSEGMTIREHAEMLSKQRSLATVHASHRKAGR